MATGYSFNGTCYATQAQANDVYYAQHTVDVLPGATPYVSMFFWDSAANAWRHATYTVGTNGLWTQKTLVSMPTRSFPTCDTATTFTDGMTVGWGIAAAMVAAWAVKNLKRSV